MCTYEWRTTKEKKNAAHLNTGLNPSIRRYALSKSLPESQTNTGQNAGNKRNQIRKVQQEKNNKRRVVFMIRRSPRFRG